MRARSPTLAFALFVLSSPLRLGYRVAIRLAGCYLKRGLSSVTVYVAGTGASREFVVGLSDIDLVVVIDERAIQRPKERAILLARWRRLRRCVGALARGLSLAVYVEHELADTATVLTYGLAAEHGQEMRGGYLRPGRPVDDLYRRIHPGLYGPGRSWRLVAGRTRTPTRPIESKDYGPLAAWLELQWWWRFASELCTSTDRAFAAYLAFKLIAEPARIWLWLAHGERVGGRREAVERALVLLPEEESVLRQALELYERLPRGTPPRHKTLTWLLRIGDRIAALLEADLQSRASCQVRLEGGEGVLSRESSAAFDELSAAWGPARSLALADWRARAMPPLADEMLVSVEAQADDPKTIGALSRQQAPGLQPAVKVGRLLVLPGNAFSDRALLRSVQFSGFDPVSFALLEGATTAVFPEAPGLCIGDCARRAMNEHAVWLSRWQRGEQRTDAALGLLLTAARAALFWESVATGDPELLLSASATVTRLGLLDPNTRSIAEDAYAAFAGHRAGGALPPSEVVMAFRGVVQKLACYMSPT